MSQPLQSQAVLLDDGSPATIFPVWDVNQLPLELVAALCVEYNAEVDSGRSFPQTQKLMLESFEKTWFSGISGVMLNGTSWERLYDFDLLDSDDCLGSFTIFPEFPGRSSHICTANFLVKRKYRNYGVGKAMAQCFMRWAIQLGYEYALFNLVYDCNIAACKILHKLGFEVLTTLKGAGILKGFNYPVDAFIFGRSLVSGSFTGHNQTKPMQEPPEQTALHDFTHEPSQEFVQNSMEGITHENVHVQEPMHESMQKPGAESTRGVPSTPEEFRQVGEFESMRLYLMKGEYPPCSTRTERTRIRSRSRSYIVRNGQLFHKKTNTAVVSDPDQQIAIASHIHHSNHNGINKVQKEILDKYYWAGVRVTITQVIKECPKCRAASQSQTLPPTPIMSSNLETPLDSSQLGTPYTPHLDTPEDPSGPSQYYDQYDAENVVYLPPENEDDEYIDDGWVPDAPDEIGDLDELFDDDGLFRDDDDDEYIEGDEAEGDEDDDDDDDDDDDPPAN